jgi:NitT/TauT family transport system substrate-binding protein
MVKIKTEDQMGFGDKLKSLCFDESVKDVKPTKPNNEKTNVPPRLNLKIEVALAEGTPSHTMLLALLAASKMTPDDIKIVKVKDAIDAAKVFKDGKVSGAVVWSPDDADCLTAISGSKILMSSKQASQIIADAAFASKKTIDANKDTFDKFVSAWLEGNAIIGSDSNKKAEAANIFAKEFNVKDDFATLALNNVRFTTLGDNINFFGFSSDYAGQTGQNLYDKMSTVYGKLGISDNPPSWRSVCRGDIIRNISLTGKIHAAEGQTKFEHISEATAVAKTSIATKQVTVNFATGSATLDANARGIIQYQFGDEVKSFGNARIRIEGNTDNTGSVAANKALSQRRAAAVASFLVNNYKINSNRISVVGNGPNKPVADNSTDDGRERNRRTDFSIIAE